MIRDAISQANERVMAEPHMRKAPSASKFAVYSGSSTVLTRLQTLHPQQLGCLVQAHIEACKKYRGSGNTSCFKSCCKLYAVIRPQRKRISIFSSTLNQILVNIQHHEVRPVSRQGRLGLFNDHGIFRRFTSSP